MQYDAFQAGGRKFHAFLPSSICVSVLFVFFTLVFIFSIYISYFATLVFVYPCH